MEVGLDAETIHLDQHLRHEQTEEDKLCIDWSEKERREGERERNGRERKVKMKEGEVMER